MNIKKLSILLLTIMLIFFSGCYDFTDVSKSMHVNSIGIDYDKENKSFIVFFHLTNASTLTTSELSSSNENNTFSIAKGEGDNIFNAIKEITKNTNKDVILTHVQTFIFTNQFLTNDNLKEFYMIIKTYPYLFPDFDIFITDSKLEELFQIKNTENISPYYSIIVEENTNQVYKLTDFNEFAKTISNNKFTISFPILQTDPTIWQNEDKKIISASISGKLYIDNNNILKIYEEDFPGILFLESKNKFELTYEDYALSITNIKYKLKYLEDDKYLIKLRGIAYVSNSNYKNFERDRLMFNNFIENELTKLLIETKDKNIDILNLKHLLYTKRKLKSSFNYKTAEFLFDISLDYRY